MASRIDDFKKENKHLNQSPIDIFKLIVPGGENKYLNLLIKLSNTYIKTRMTDDSNNSRINHLSTEWGLDREFLLTLDQKDIRNIYTLLDYYVDQNDFTTFLKFCELNDKGLIDNKDITSYSTGDQLLEAVSKAEVKSIGKEAQSFIHNLFEDEEWIILRPLSLEASIRYGAATKWCTTSKSDDYFERYIKRGILIYIVNKKTGFKIGFFKNLDPNRERETSFWDAKSDRIDSLDIGLPIEIIEVIKNEIKNNIVTNAKLAGLSDYLDEKSVKKSRLSSLVGAINDNTTFEAQQRLLAAINEMGGGIDIDEQ